MHSEKMTFLDVCAQNVHFLKILLANYADTGDTAVVGEKN